MEKKYRNRVLDEILSERLESSGAVLLEGAKWCGKTTTCERQAKSFIYLSDPKYRGQYLRIAETEIDQLLEGATPRLIDEWQDIPELWDAIRHKVDHRDGMGQYLLTGSSVIPDKSKKKIRHSGTGRYSWLKMRPMSLWESGESSGEVSIAALFAKQDFTAAKALERKLSETAFSICRGGWPLAVDRTGAAALRLARDYCRAVAESDISRFDDIPRDPERVRNLMRSYARLQGTQASVASIRKDMMQHDERSLSEDTIHSYLKALRGIFVIEDATAWCPELRAKDTVRTSGTRYFTDPSIAAAVLGVMPDDLMNDLRSFGFFFEGMVMRDLRIYMDALDGSVRHYHDKTGLECDAVMHTWSGAYALAEIKLGGEKLVEEGVRTLNKLSSLVRAKEKTPPTFMMVVTATGEFAYRRKEDGIIVCPISALKP